MFSPETHTKLFIRSVKDPGYRKPFSKVMKRASSSYQGVKKQDCSHSKHENSTPSQQVFPPFRKYLVMLLLSKGQCLGKVLPVLLTHLLNSWL